MKAGQPLVLCYHGVSSTWEHALAVRPEAIVQQIRSLLRRRWRPVTAREVVRGSGRLFHVTFDDALTSISPSLDVLRSLNVPGTVFACSAFADRGRTVFDVPELESEARALPEELQTFDWNGLRELADRGVEIGAHTRTHPHLTTLSDAALDDELRSSRERIADEVRRPCSFLAYPYGEHDARVREAARRAGYIAAFALPGVLRSSDVFEVPRVGVYRRDDRLRFWAKTSGIVRASVELRRRG